MDENATAGWTLSPQDYLAARSPSHDGERLHSCYVTVRDGTRLAVDVHLPGTEDDGARYPAILILTPYYRRFALRPGHDPATDPCPTVAFYRDLFVPRGYALVAVDVRGSGASFGCRDGFRSPRERLDHHDVADWVCGQSWCDGRLGATGISYPGAAADFLASTNHPAVKAVAPLCAVWDTWGNHLYPGGVLLTCVTRRYGQLAEALDLDRRDLIPPFAYFNHPDLSGPAPVDDDGDATLLSRAMHEHHANFDMQDFAQQLRYRDAGPGDDPDYTGEVISPYHYANREADGSTAVYAVSGWMDGGGFSLGAIQRYLWLENPSRRLMLGPWDHGARAHASPWRGSAHEGQQAFMGGEVLRFFDVHLKGMTEALAKEQPVHYYTLGEERWKAAGRWPPPARDLTLFTGASHTLSADVPADAGGDVYQADYACGSGVHSRYDRLYIASVDTYYDDWHGREDTMLSFTGEALDIDTEVTGHPYVDLHFTCSEKDCTFFVYLSDVTPEGRSVYVTEGVFRALHRAPGNPPARIPTTGPGHSFRRNDARLLVPGQPEAASFELLPTSYLFRAGHRIRLSLALADSDHFTRIPAGRPPRITLLRGAGQASRLVLPVACS